MDWKTCRQVKESENSRASGIAVEFSAESGDLSFRLLRPWGRRRSWRLTAMRGDKIIHDESYDSESDAKMSAAALAP